MMIQDADYFAEFENMPTAMASFVRHNPDGTYTIMLNARMDHETLCRAYQHELMHIQRGDIDSDRPAGEIEKEVHKAVD